ncbi:MAG TPA: glycosyltransferase family 2 protein, partial [Candidatus Angelobacter sp.]
VFGACAGAAAYRRRMLDDIGFFDEDFFGTYEDLDLSFRAQLRGYACMFVPGAIVYHRLTATMKKYPARQAYLSQRNVEYAYWKNMPLELMARGLPHRMLYELGAAAYFLRRGVGKAFFSAKLDAIQELPAILRKRKEIQNRKTVSNVRLRLGARTAWVRGRWNKLVAAWRRTKQPSGRLGTL